MKNIKEIQKCVNERWKGLNEFRTHHTGDDVVYNQKLLCLNQEILKDLLYMLLAEHTTTESE